jgi:membrane fusion protein (multidrug efflux system)
MAGRATLMSEVTNTASAPRPAATSRPVRRVLTAGALLACLAAGSAFGQVLEVRVVQPERRDLSRISTQPATAEALYEADLGAKVSGQVIELNVDIGDRVAEGQVLARIAVPELIQARNAAAAQVRALRSAYERTAALAERNSVTQRSLVEAQSRLDGAVAAEAEAEAELAYATIQAPFAGTVTSRAIDPGDMVYQASSPKGSGQPLLRVAKTDVIRIKTYVPERDSIWVDVGDAATVAFDALPGQGFTATVARLTGVLDPATRTMQVEVDLPNPDGRIRPGFYGQTRLVLERRPAALALPTAAVRRDASGPHVFVVDTDNVARRVAVEPGLEDTAWTEVAQGLSGSERVITGAAPNLADGAGVRVLGP